MSKFNLETLCDEHTCVFILIRMTRPPVFNFHSLILLITTSALLALRHRPNSFVLNLLNVCTKRATQEGEQIQR